MGIVMVTQRERLRERGLSQISVWLPDESVVQIKGMAERLGLSLPKLIERALLAYQPDGAVGGDVDRLDAIEARLVDLESVDTDKPTSLVDLVVDSVRSEFVSSIAADFARLETRLAALEALPGSRVAGQGSYPASAASGACVSLPAAPSGGDRGAMAALRDPVIIELHKQGLMHREIQVELCKRGIFAKGKDGNPSPISTGLISTILKKAGLGNAVLATD